MAAQEISPVVRYHMDGNKVTIEDVRLPGAEPESFPDRDLQGMALGARFVRTTEGPYELLGAETIFTEQGLLTFLQYVKRDGNPYEDKMTSGRLITTAQKTHTDYPTNVIQSEGMDFVHGAMWIRTDRHTHIKERDIVSVIDGSYERLMLYVQRTMPVSRGFAFELVTRQDEEGFTIDRITDRNGADLNPEEILALATVPRSIDIIRGEGDKKASLPLRLVRDTYDSATDWRTLLFELRESAREGIFRPETQLVTNPSGWITQH